MKKDIFISYKNDNAGNNFAYRLKADIEKMGYSVYFNSDEKHSGDFPEKLRTAVEDCKDFILIVSQKCLDQLMEHKKVDWIREEILTARKNNKPIIPILLDGVKMPADVDVMPEELRFLPKIDNISMPEKYDISLVTIENGTHSSRIPEYVMHKCILPDSDNVVIRILKKVVYKLPSKVFFLIYSLITSGKPPRMQ
jgi:hypothetical protein